MNNEQIPSNQSSGKKFVAFCYGSNVVTKPKVLIQYNKLFLFKGGQMPVVSFRQHNTNQLINS